LDTLPAVGGKDAVDAERDVKLTGFPEISEGKIMETGDLLGSGHSIALQKKLLVGDEQIFLSQKKFTNSRPTNGITDYNI
jgi:hypothetical protein